MGADPALRKASGLFAMGELMQHDVQVNVVADALEAQLTSGSTPDTDIGWASNMTAAAARAISVSKAPKPGKSKPTATGTICEQARRIERQQWAFVIAYQILVLILAAATIALLTWLTFQLAKSGSTSGKTATAKALGGLVTGTASLWVSRQRKDARVQHDAAMKIQQRNQCP